MGAYHRYQYHRGEGQLEMVYTLRLKHPKAFAMPLGKLRDKAQVLPKDRLYIPFCQFSLRGYEAQKILEGIGFKKVKFMDGGVTHWPYELESGSGEPK